MLLLFLLHFLVADCLEVSEQECSLDVKDIGPHEWSQTDADSHRSRSIKVRDDVEPPQEQTLNFPLNLSLPCKVEVDRLILTTSGRIIGSSFCPEHIQRKEKDVPVDAFLFSESFQIDGSWTQEIPTILPLFANWISSSDGEYIFFHYANENSTRIPSFAKTQTGELVTIDSETKHEWISTISFVKTKSTFLKTGGTYNAQEGFVSNVESVDPSSRKMISSGYVGLGHSVSQVWDPSSGYLATIELDLQTVTSHLNVLDVEQTESGIQINKLWSYTFPVGLVSTPTYSNDGRLFVVGPLSNPLENLEYGLFIFDGKSGTIISSTPLFPADLLYQSMTSDGKYVLVAGNELFTDPPQVLSTDDGTSTRRIDLYEASGITIDDDNKIVYASSGCQLIGFCLQNPNITHWNVTICDTNQTKTSTLILGRYSGGQRRLFVGFGEVESASQVKIIEPPSHSCN